MIIYEVNVSTELENAQMTKNTQNFFDVPACCCSCFFLQLQHGDRCLRMLYNNSNDNNNNNNKFILVP